MLEFDARVVGSELPICFGVVFVSIGFPRGDLLDERGSVRNSAGEALRRENAEFGFGEVEPAAVCWRIMSFEPLSEPARRGGRKSLVERSWFMRVEVVLHEDDLLRLGKVRFRQVF